MKTKISPLDIIQAFPEAKQLINQEINNWQIKKQQTLDMWDSLIKKAKRLKGFDKVFWLEVISRTMDKTAWNHLDRLKRMRTLCSEPGKRGYQSMTVKIERARLKPIIDIYPFEKVQRAYSGKVKALCPFHEEKTPSFVIYTATNTWNCFGGCDGGDSIKFVMKLKGCGFKEAVNILNTN